MIRQTNCRQDTLPAIKGHNPYLAVEIPALLVVRIKAILALLFNAKMAYRTTQA
jgi:hypothetical protein